MLHRIFLKRESIKITQLSHILSGTTWMSLEKLLLKWHMQIWIGFQYSFIEIFDLWWFLQWNNERGNFLPTHLYKQPSLHLDIRLVKRHANKQGSQEIFLMFLIFHEKSSHLRKIKKFFWLTFIIWCFLLEWMGSQFYFD